MPSQRLLPPGPEPRTHEAVTLPLGAMPRVEFGDKVTVTAGDVLLKVRVCWAMATPQTPSGRRQRAIRVREAFIPIRPVLSSGGSASRQCYRLRVPRVLAECSRHAELRRNFPA